MGAPGPPPRRISLWVGVLVLAAVALGGAAALLTAPVAPNPPSYFYPGFNISPTEAGWLVIGFVLLWIAHHFYERRRYGSASIPNRALTVAFVSILLLVAFVFVARALGPVEFGGGSPPQGGGGNATPTATINNTTNLSVHSIGFEPLHVGGWTIPGWVEFAAILGVAAVVGLVAIPAYFARQAARPSAPGAATARRDFADALRSLRDPEEPDVRAVIIALYARLLLRVSPALGDLDTQAPREIEMACVNVLHIQPSTARSLTALFEEARYSTHALDAATGARAQEVFRQALSDLDSTRLRAA